MRVRSIINRALAVVGTSIVMATTMPAMAHAQLVDFMWGGDSEWGGKRSTVAFNSKFRPGQVIVSFGDRRLYLITKPGTAMSYPIAVPREQSRWQGRLNVTQKRENPSWTPAPEMLRETPRLPAWVPGGHPMNPLGVRALYLGSSTYRIHGTDAPWTIGQDVSHGCIRIPQWIAVYFPTLVNSDGRNGDYVYVWGMDGKQPEENTDQEMLPVFNFKNPNSTLTTTTTTIATSTTVKDTATTKAPTTTAATTTEPPPTSGG